MPVTTFLSIVTEITQMKEKGEKKMSQTSLKFCTTSTTTVVCSRCWMSCSKRLLSWIPNTSQIRLSNRFDTLCQYLKIDPYIVVKWDMQTVKPKKNWFFYVTLCLFGVFFTLLPLAWSDKLNKLNLTLMSHQTCSTRAERKWVFSLHL